MVVAIPDLQMLDWIDFKAAKGERSDTRELFKCWDYNNDGVQDTISVPGCGSLGCHVAYSDTIVGGYRNEYGNILGTFSAGPFKLKAGDTTQFLFAFSWSPDSISTRKTWTVWVRVRSRSPTFLVIARNEFASSVISSENIADALELMSTL